MIDGGISSEVGANNGWCPIPFEFIFKVLCKHEQFKTAKMTYVSIFSQ